MKLKDVTRRGGSGFPPGQTTALLLLAGVPFGALAAPPPLGVAPLNLPAGGFGIDGDLSANTPSVHVGDWLYRTNWPGAGGAVLDPAGLPLNPATTFHFVDPYNGNDSIFAGGRKWTDNPNTWAWTTGKPSGKTDINHVLLHLATDAQGHVWSVVSADRASTSGDSYIDFEFLQNPLVRTNNGLFLSAGPHGGRTTNDLLLSLAFTGGGKVADFFAWRWLPNGSGRFAYVDVTTSLPAGKVFVALNSNSIVVPYGAFGQTNYTPNAFAEAAIDLTALMASFDPCRSFGFRTIMVKTKSSASDSASIEDFIDPIQYVLNIGPSADAGPDQARCAEAAATAFPLQGAVTPGIYPIASTTWSVVEGIATIESPGSLITTASVASARATVRLTVVQANGCTEMDEVVLTVKPLPACAIAGPAVVCPQQSVQFSSPAGMESYSWAISGNGSISGPAHQRTVTVLPGTACGESFMLTLTVTSNLCPTTCASEVLVNDTTPPGIICPPDMVLECPADTRTNVTGVARAEDDCGPVAVSFSDAITNGCGGEKVIARTWTATDGCGNRASCVQTITVRDTTRPAITCPPNLVLECPANTSTNVTGVATAQDACGQVTIGYSDTVTNTCGNTRVILRTWTATDQCGNSTNCVQTLTVRDTIRPTITCPPSLVLECPADTGTNATGVATAQDACGQVTIGYSDTVTNTCGNTRVILRTWTATDQCGNSTNCVQTLTVRDTIRPTITCPPNLVLECPANTSTNVTGVATAQDACSSVTIRFSDSVSNSCGGAKVIARTWTATDACSNSASCLQTITVRDTTPPAITCPPDLVVECGGSTAPGATGTATAQDACSSVTISYSDSVSNLCGGAKIISRTWTATDACNNKATCLQKITVRDTTPPSILCRVVCTYSQGGWSGGGGPAQLLAANYLTVFPQGVMLGILNTNNGNAAPNGLYWQPNAAGLAALQAAASVGGGSSTAITRDAINPTETYGAASLGRQTLALTFNIAFNAAGLLGAGPNNFGLLIYTKAGSSLSGKTVSEILEVANRALAGLGLPAGYDFSSLTSLINDLNLSFHDCTVSSFAATSLSGPSVVVQCGSQVPAPNPGFVSASDACSAVTLSVLPDVVTNQSCPNRFTLVRTWVARDACGNSNACSFPIIVDDTTPPRLTNLTNRTVAGGQAWSFDQPSATDNCGAVTVRVLSTVTNLTGPDSFAATRIWEAVDACGNSSTTQQTITVAGLPPPVLAVYPNGNGMLTLSWSALPPGYLPERCESLVSGNWTLVGTIPVLSNGFYYVEVAAGPTPMFYRLTKAPPRLELLRVGAGRLLLRWPVWADDYRLEATESLSAPDWKPVALQAAGLSGPEAVIPVLSNGVYQVEFTPGAGHQFYRLSKAPPRLELLRSGAGGLLLRWPTLPAGFQLETSDTLTSPSWSMVSVTPLVSNAFNHVQFTPISPRKFYRLRKPGS